MYQELQSERAWLESQLKAEVVSKNKEQWELRKHLEAQQEHAVQSELDSKHQMRRELESELLSLRCAMRPNRAA